MRAAALTLSIFTLLAGCAAEPEAAPAPDRAADLEAQAAALGDMVPGTDIPIPQEYAPGGKINYAYRVALFAEHPPAPGALAMVGDSITEGGDWPRLLPGVRTANFGVGWDRTSGLLARLSQIDAAKPSKIALLIGTNDIGNAVPVAEVAANADRIIAALTALAPGAVLVQAVMPREAQFRHEIETLNAALAESAERHGAAFLDTYAPFLAGESLDPSVTDDSLHLNEAGYARWAALLQDWAGE